MSGAEYISNDICFPFADYDQFMYFDKDGIIDTQTINSRWNASNIEYAYTMSIWIKPAAGNCYQPFPAIAAANCSVVLFDDVFMLYFESPNVAKI